MSNENRPATSGSMKTVWKPLLPTHPPSIQVERRSPQQHYRPRHTVYGAKMRASVRMTRYLESWGAAKPFANLHHRDSMTNENGKINTVVSTGVWEGKRTKANTKALQG